MNPTNPTGGFGCDTFSEELSLFAFGELDGERRDALERHLVECAACRGERDALVRSLELLKLEGARGAAESAPQLSPARQANLIAQAQAVAPKQGRVIAWKRAAVAASVIATVGAGVFWWEGIVRENRDAELTAASGVNNFLLAAPPEYAKLDRPKARENVDQPKKVGDASATEVAGPAAAAVKRDRRGEATGPLDDMLRKQVGQPVPAVDPTSNVPALSPPAPKESGPAGPKSGVIREMHLRAPSPASGTVGGAAKGEQPAGAKDGATTPLSVSDSAGLDGDGYGYTTNPPTEGIPTDSSRVDELLALVEETRFEKTDDLSRIGYVDEESEQLRRAELVELQKLGYSVPDSNSPTGDQSSLGDRSLAGADAKVRALSAEQLGRLLAASLSPAQLMRVQALIVAKLGTPAGQPPRPNLEADRDVVIHEFLDRLSRRQSEPPRDMFFRYFGDHPFLPTRVDAKSTFGMDVDTASYALVRSYLSRGTLPPKAAVRTEEFVNAFRHDLAPPDADGVAKFGLVRDDDRAPEAGFAAPAARDVFAIHTELAPSPFGEDGQYLLQIGLKAREIPKSQRKPVALTFVIDVSGSMAQDGRLELVKTGLHLLIDQLTARDTVGIVSFETIGRRVLDPIDGTQRARIYAALDTLRPEGSTNADAGLSLGYEMALAQLRPNAENRVILCSDGVANTGVTDPKRLSARIAECKSKYIYLNCVGVGMGNHNDALMEQLADEGDGFCAYLDRIEEAKKLFVDRLTGTLLTVARDAKIQVEFDPAGVRRFRQLGYENRALAHRDFRNDKVDAGEVGAGQEVVALYEIELARDAKGPLAAVRVRYEDPDAGQVREQERRVDLAELRPTLQQATPRFRLSACVAEFAEILRQSVHARDGSLGAVERLAEPLVDELKGDPDVPEFVALVQQAARLPDLIPARSGLARAVDEVKKFHCWREELREGADEEMLRQIEEQNRRLEQALRDALDRALRRS